MTDAGCKFVHRINVMTIFVTELESIMLYKSNLTTNLNNLPDSPFTRNMSLEKSHGMGIIAKLVLAN